MIIPEPNRRALLICASARVAAIVSSFFVDPGSYFVAMDVPWLPNEIHGRNELIRSMNVLARVRPAAVLIGPMSDEARKTLSAELRGVRVVHLPSLDEVFAAFGAPDAFRTHLSGCEESELATSLWRWAATPQTRSRDLICLEPRHPIDDVAVANLAIATRADLKLIQIASEDEERIRLDDELLRSARPRRGRDAIDQELIKRLARYHGNLELDRYDTVTFVTKDTPHGLAVPRTVTACHIPHIRGLPRVFTEIMLYEIDEESRTYTAIVCDPEFFPESESNRVCAMLRGLRWNIRQLRGADVSYDAFDSHIQFFPHDVLLIASHGGNVPGRYNIWIVRDVDGKEHTFECEEVMALSAVRPDGKVRVSMLTVPVRVDGVFWTDKEGKKAIDAGSVFRRFMALHRLPESRDLVLDKSYEVPRVSFSNAVILHNNRFHFLAVHALGLREHPLVFNNSCGSWADLSKKVLFAGARAYVCTARPVFDEDATNVAIRFFELALGGVPLAEALRRAASDLADMRNVYVYVGLPFSTLRSPERSVDTQTRWTRRAMELQTSFATRLQEEAEARLGRDLEEVVLFIQNAIREFGERLLR